MRYLNVLIIPLTLACLVVRNPLSAGAQTESEVPSRVIPGLDGPVEIARDEWGVPTIRAETDHDLFMGLGYAMAQDRLWQMDGSRRLARGRVAQIAGREQLHWDIYHRVLGLGRVADESVLLIDPITLEYLQAFADGVNAFIETGSAEFSFEFALLNYQPEPWGVADSLAVARLVAAWLSGDAWEEEMYGELIRSLGEDTASRLFRPVPEGEPDYTGSGAGEPLSGGDNFGIERLFSASRIDEPEQDRAMESVRRKLISSWFEPLACMHLAGHVEASNIWAVDGSMTESGEPILAMDPHLNYFSPSILYEAILDGGDFHCWGATFPGMPFMPFGANDHIAWGASNLPADCQDLYVERLNPANPLQYEVDGSWRAFDIIHERIPFRSGGGEEQTYLQDIYISRHGPIVQQSYGQYVALKWTGLTPSDDVTSFVKVMRAESLEDFYEAFRDYHCPPQNFCCAESGPDGRVGQVIAGDIPVRSGYDGTHPVEGRDSTCDWAGFIPYDDLPHRLDPPEGFVVHANNVPRGAMTGGERPLGGSLSTNHRVNRMIELLLENEPFDFDDMRLMQMDDVDTTARVFVPALLASWEREGGDYPELLEHVSLLRGWDYRLAMDSIPASLYQLWLIELVQSCIMPEVKYGLSSYLGYVDRWLPLLEDYVRGESDLDWLEDDTAVERDRRLLDALESTVERLRREVGSDVSKWTWGELNQAIFPHPSGMALFVGGGTHPWGGGRYTLRVGHYAVDSPLPFENDFGAVLRVVAESVDGRWHIGAVLPPGESGCSFWPHGDDQISLWLAGELRPVHFGADEGSPSAYTLILNPQ